MENTHHRPPDPDLLERFVLGRLDPAKRAEVENLVRTSAEWREALRREQILAAGVRRLGRAGIRQRISERVHIPPRYALPWPRIVVAAAVLCIIVGVGILNQWFVPSPQPDTAIVEHLEKEGESSNELTLTTPQEITTGDLAAAGGDQTPPAPTGTAELETGDKAEERGEEVALRRAAKVKKEEPKVPAPGAETREHDRAEEPATAMVPEPSPVGAYRAVSQFWTQGELFSADAGALEKQRAGESPEANVQDSRAQVDRALAARERQEFGAALTVSQSASLQQKPFSTLDEVRQQGYAKAAPRMLPTLIERRGDSLYLTLYPDSPFSDVEMQGAKVFPVTKDSLVVTVGSQQIRYHLPESFLQTRDGRTTP